MSGTALPSPLDLRIPLVSELIAPGQTSRVPPLGPFNTIIRRIVLMNSKTRNLTAAAQVDFSFLNGRNILITGGTGSFGRAFTRLILEKAGRSGSSSSRATS